MDLNQNTPTSSAPIDISEKKKVPLGGLVVLFGLVVIIGLYYIFNNYDSFNPNSSAQGKLYLSLFPIDRSEDQSMYTLDLAKGDLSKIFNQEELSFFSLDGVLSPDGSKIAYVRNDYESSNYEIVIRDIESEETAPISLATPSLKLGPRWSRDGSKIAFYEKIRSSTGQLSIEDWDVRIIDTETGFENIINAAVQPNFVSNDQIIVLRSDGLYAYKLNGQGFSGRKIWEILDGVGLINMKIDVSDDSSFIAWSIPDKGKINVIEIKSLEPFSGEIIKTINDHVFWVVFSPDSKHLATQSVDWDNLSTNPNPKIVLYDLSGDNLSSRELFDLSSYNQNFLFLSDWR